VVEEEIDHEVVPVLGVEVEWKMLGWTGKDWVQKELEVEE
jgi:hypothetical protein